MKTTSFRQLTLLAIASGVFGWLLLAPVLADEPVFSGPQVGEKLAPFKIRGVFDGLAGKELDLVKQAEGKPLVLVFVHELTRPSVGTMRAVMDYAAKLSKQGVTSGVIFLSEDATAMEERLKRARHAMPKDVPVGISTDGKEGPGAYGLNRKMTLTVLVGKAGKVTANFPLIQPSVQADAPKIAAAIAQAAGVKPPTAAELGASRQEDAGLRPLLRAVIQKDAGKETVDKAAEKIEVYVAKRPAARRQLGQIARRIVNAGVVERYGTPRAQEHIRAWAKKYGGQDAKKKPKDRP